MLFKWRFQRQADQKQCSLCGWFEEKHWLFRFVLSWKEGKKIVLGQVNVCLRIHDWHIDLGERFFLDTLESLVFSQILEQNLGCVFSYSFQQALSKLYTIILIFSFITSSQQTQGNKRGHQYSGLHIGISYQCFKPCSYSIVVPSV